MPDRPEFIEELRATSRGLPYRPAKRKADKSLPVDFSEAGSLFTVCTGNRWLELGEREPEAKMLFGEFWRQGELCMLFADTNTGKSVLAVQIGDNIARLRGTGPFACQAKHETVLYADFELSTTQFYQRYSHPKGDYDFPANFYRAQFNPVTGVAANFTGYDDYLIAGLEEKIRLVKATVLIIDNISCLRGGTESSAVALRLMNNLKNLKTELRLSILVLAHTPKRRNLARPISADDLHGSKLLVNFADSAFSIGKSTAASGQRYLRQVKQRNTRQLYGDDNVCLCSITKPGNFLQFEFEGYSDEAPLLRTGNRPGNNRLALNRDELSPKIQELSANGLSQRQIARELHIAPSTVNKLMKMV